MSLGPLMIDLAGPRLGAEESQRLCHPAVGGVILFSRNYEEPRQLRELCRAIHALREPRLLVAVDQEGGRVQRFRAPFTALPAAARFGELYDRDPRSALRAARAAGRVTAGELRAVDVDLSFAPVLDVRNPASAVIGERAYHADPEVVADLARAWIAGAREAGMAAVGKHFPGHGSVGGDSHHELPVDLRDLESLALADMLAFERAVHGGIPALMTAHLLLPAVDQVPVSRSRSWIASVLRRRLGFSGAVFSDDLAMQGAAGADLPERAERSLDAGCDMVLVCNRAREVDMVIERLAPRAVDPLRAARVARLHARGRPPDLDVLLSSSARFADAAWVASIEPEPELDLDGDRPA